MLYSDILTALSSRKSQRGSIRPERVSLGSPVTLDARRRGMRAVMDDCVRLYERLRYLPMSSSNEAEVRVQYVHLIAAAEVISLLSVEVTSPISH